MGQKKTVRVFQLIAEDSIESKVLEIRQWLKLGLTSGVLIHREAEGRSGCQSKFRCRAYGTVLTVGV